MICTILLLVFRVLSRKLLILLLAILSIILEKENSEKDNKQLTLNTRPGYLKQGQYKAKMEDGANTLLFFKVISTNLLN